MGRLVRRVSRESRERLALLALRGLLELQDRKVLPEKLDPLDRRDHLDRKVSREYKAPLDLLGQLDPLAQEFLQAEQLDKCLQRQAGPTMTPNG